MAKWNMFSPEVAEERRRVSAYGFDGEFKIVNRVPVADSYKAQALRELAMRLELEQKYNELLDENSRMVDRLESLELQVSQ